MELSNVIDNHNRSKEIIEKLLSKKISRDMPSKLFKIEQIIGEKIQRNQYIELLGLWGGSKEGIPGDEADKKSLDSLVYIRNKSRDIRISLLFCDFHHHYANNVSWEETIKYFEVLYNICDQSNIYLIKLSDHAFMTTKKTDNEDDKNTLKSVYNDKILSYLPISKDFYQIIKKLKYGANKHYRDETLKDYNLRWKKSIANSEEKYSKSIEITNKQVERLEQYLKNISEKYKRKERLQKILNTTKERLNSIKNHARWESENIKKDIDRILIPSIEYYVDLEIHFLKIIKEKYPDTIFFSFSDPDIQKPIAEAANVPMFYFHADMHGGKFKNHVPWYSGTVDSEKQQS